MDPNKFLKYFIIYIYIYIYIIFVCLFWLHWVFVAVCGLSLAVASRGYSLVEVLGLLVTVASHCRAQALG